MAFLNIDKKRYKYLLNFGADSEELRKFFLDNRKPLILAGAKVQNLPRGPSAAVTTMINLPRATDSIVQKWFHSNITMINPVDVDEVIDTFQLYELYQGDGEGYSDAEAKKLCRSCLIHLFSPVPPQQLIEFLSSSINGAVEERDPAPEIDTLTSIKQAEIDLSFLQDGLAPAMVSLIENSNPDKYLVNLPPLIASFITGLYAIKNHDDAELSNTFEDLKDSPNLLRLLTEFTARSRAQSIEPLVSGFQLIRFEDDDQEDFDFDLDEIIGKCTRDSPESAVFIQPIAIRKPDGRLITLDLRERRVALFPNSGDIQAFSGRTYPKQPKRNEIGIWRVSPNDLNSSGVARNNNYHLKGSKTDIYEVQLVPFSSEDPESVRGFIKHTFLQVKGKDLTEPLLFLLTDDLFLKCPSGRDFTRDEAFDDGLISWRSLTGFRFEGRLLVPGPLPVPVIYECGTLASTLKKFLATQKLGIDKLTKAQQRYLIDSINSGEVSLNSKRGQRLIKELEYIGNDSEALNVLLDEAIKDERVATRISALIQEKVLEQTERKSELVKEITQLEMQLNNQKEQIANQEKEYRALPPAISKAIRETIKRAKGDLFNTLSEVVVYKELLEGLGMNQASASSYTPNVAMHELGSISEPISTLLKEVGFSVKHSRAIELTVDIVLRSGLILIIEGNASNLVAEAIGRRNAFGCKVFNCAVGLMEALPLLKQNANEDNRSIVIRDANLSPVDVYARHLIDNVQQKLIKKTGSEFPWVLMSLTEGVASLPLSKEVASIAVHLDLDKKPEFIREDDAITKMEEFDEDIITDEWAAYLWRPAFRSLFKLLKECNPNDISLIFSILSLRNKESIHQKRI